MAYSTESDIQKELKNISFSSNNSQVTSAAVSDFIDQADALIDMYIGQRYETPVTGTKSLRILKKISIDFVVYRITKILDLKKSVPVPDDNVIQDITEGTAYRNSMKILKDIRDNVMKLPDATLLDAASGLASFHTETGNSDIVPLFDKECQQW